MNMNNQNSERGALVASILITLIGWVYMVVSVGGKLLAPGMV